MITPSSFRHSAYPAQAPRFGRDIFVVEYGSHKVKVLWGNFDDANPSHQPVIREKNSLIDFRGNAVSLMEKFVRTLKMIPFFQEELQTELQNILHSSPMGPRKVQEPTWVVFGTEGLRSLVHQRAQRWNQLGNQLQRLFQKQLGKELKLMSPEDEGENFYIGTYDSIRHFSPKVFPFLENQPLLMVDMGRASTELVLGHGPTPEEVISIPLKPKTGIERYTQHNSRAFDTMEQEIRQKLTQAMTPSLPNFEALANNRHPKTSEITAVMADCGSPLDLLRQLIVEKTKEQGNPLDPFEKPVPIDLFTDLLKDLDSLDTQVDHLYKTTLRPKGEPYRPEVKEMVPSRLLVMAALQQQFGMEKVLLSPLGGVKEGVFFKELRLAEEKRPVKESSSPQRKNHAQAYPPRTQGLPNHTLPVATQATRFSKTI